MTGCTKAVQASDVVSAPAASDASRKKRITDSVTPTGFVSEGKGRGERVYAVVDGDTQVHTQRD